jgi:hypothetical protein
MNLICKLPSAALLLVIAGCATEPGVQSRVDTSARFNSSKTFAVLPVTVDPAVPRGTASAVVEAARLAPCTLRALGYSEAKTENADLVFYLHGKSMELRPLRNGTICRILQIWTHIREMTANATPDLRRNL